MNYILRRAETGNMDREQGELRDLHDLIALLQRPDYWFLRRVLLTYAKHNDGTEDRETCIISLH